MSQPASKSDKSGRGLLVQQPLTSVYTVLLLLSLVAILLGCVMLGCEISSYRKEGEGFFDPVQAVSFRLTEDRQQYRAVVS